MVYLALRRCGDSRVAIEAALLLDLPESDSDSARWNSIYAEEKRLKLRLLQPVQLSNHGSPAPVNQRTEQTIKSEEVLADVRLEHHSIVEATRLSTLVPSHL
jgi:hypothetical protein